MNRTAVSNPAIRAENLSKAYRIGHREEVPDTLTQACLGWARAPWKNLQRLRRLDTSQAGRVGRAAVKAGENATSRGMPSGQLRSEDDVLWALKDVCFEVEEGTVVGIIGRNGAGKSTLLKLLSRITEPTYGQATVRGRVSSLLEVGTGFHPELTGRENLYMNGTILGMTKREIDRKFDEIVDFSGVERFLDTPIKRYSSGMQVRLAFAVAAHLEPEILVIDEVLAVGDAHFQQRCLGKMHEMATSGRTVLFVSHNTAVVESLCSVGILMERGQITSIGGVRDIVARYRSELSSSTRNDSTILQQARVLERVAIGDSPQSDNRQIPLGGSLHITLTMQSGPHLNAPVIGIGFDDSFGSRILTVHSTLPPLANRSLGRNVDVACVIEQLPLPPGEYTLKVAIHGAEEFSRLGPFRVLDCDAFGDGRGFHRGMCVAHSRWSVDCDRSAVNQPAPESN